MTQTFDRNDGIGTSGNFDYTPSDVTAHTGNQSGAGQRLTIWNHAGQILGFNGDSMSVFGWLKPRPCLVICGCSGWTDATYTTSITAAGAITGRLPYELLKRGWIVVSIEVTEAGATVTGNGAAHLPTDAAFADKTRPAWNKDVVYALQWIHKNAATYNIDRTRIYGMGASSSAHILAWGGLRTFIAGEYGDAGTDAQYGYEPYLAGLYGVNLPWTWEVWPANKAIVGGVAATTLTGDTVGGTKASIPTAYQDGFSPYQWVKDKRFRRVPMFLPYTPNGVSIGTRLEEPFDAVETDNHPLIQGEIAKRQLSGEWAPGIPLVRVASTNINGATPYAGVGEVELLPDTSNTLDTPLLRESLQWFLDVDAVLAPEDYERRTTRTILTNASTEWHLAAAPKPGRKGPVRIFPLDIVQPEGASRTVLVDNGAGYTSTTTTINVDNGAGDNPVPEVRVGERFRIAPDAETFYTVETVTPAATETAITFKPGLATAVVDNQPLYFTGKRWIEVLCSEDSMKEPATSTSGEYLAVNIRSDPEPFRAREIETEGAVWVRSTHSLSESVNVED